MQYRPLGRTDINVSQICLGTMTWGEQNSEADAFAQMDYAFDQGINFFDTAEMYPIPGRQVSQGETERCIGNWLKQSGKRSDLILATKVTGYSAPDGYFGYLRGGTRLSRPQIFEAVEGSLARLQTDTIDLYQLHWPDRSTNFFGPLGYVHREEDRIPIEETLSAMDDLVTQGKIRHVGISNETPWGLMEYLRISKDKDLARVVSIQNPYSLLNRSFEIGLAECSIREAVGLLAYSPLAFGMLSGKYMSDDDLSTARLNLFPSYNRYGSAEAQAATEAYVGLARAHGFNPAQMALAFVNSRQFLTSTIIGATNLDQLKTNIGSVDVTLTDELMTEIDAIHRKYVIPSP